MKLLHPEIGGALIWAGLLFSLTGFAFLVWREFMRLPAAPRAPASRVLPTGRWLAFLALVLAVGLAVRLAGLDHRTLSHPEIYIPGIDLPSYSEPPPRHHFWQTLKWQFFSEPHPFGYFMAMWAWAKLFGTSAISIRLPEALLGSAAVWLTYRLAAKVYGTRVGVIAAALIAVQGFEVFWSQAARMYAPGAFLGLYSTLLLIDMRRQTRPSPGREAAYVLTVIAGAMTVEFFWPLLVVQMAWAALARPARGGRSRVMVYQAIAFIMASPLLDQAVLGARGDAAPPPNLHFIEAYFTFGLALENGPAPWPIPAALSLLFLAFSLLLLACALAARPAGALQTASEADPVTDPPSGPALSAPPAWVKAPLLLGAWLVMAGLTVMVHSNRKTMLMVAILSAIAALTPAVIGGLRGLVSRRSPSLDRLLAGLSSEIALIWMLAFLPTGAIVLASFAMPLLAIRAFTIFSPFVLILIAAGASVLSRKRIDATVVGVSLAVVMLTSLYVAYRSPNSPTDYRALAKAIHAREQPGDLVFTAPGVWYYSPMAVYLDQRRLVGRKFPEAMAAHPNARVWVLRLSAPVPGADAALAGYMKSERVAVGDAGAELFLPRPVVVAAPSPPR